MQTPVYPPFLGCGTNVGRRMITNELVDDGSGYAIDFDGLRAGLDPGAGAIMFCNPQNPTGRVFARDELEQLGQIAVERDLVIISDEIHADLVFPPHEHIPMATLGPEVEARTITLYSATKAFNIAGLRCSVAAFGSASLQKRFQSIPRHALGGIGTLGLAATELAWTRGQPWLDAGTVRVLPGRSQGRAQSGKELWPGRRGLRSPELRDLAQHPQRGARTHGESREIARPLGLVVC